jgi:hypothetical protein
MTAPHEIRATAQPVLRASIVPQNMRTACRKFTMQILMTMDNRGPVSGYVVMVHQRQRGVSV